MDDQFAKKENKADPFDLGKQDVEEAMRGLETIFKNWSDLYNSRSSANYDEFSFYTEELTKGFDTIELDLRDLEETIGIVEKNVKKFNISQYELINRKNYVNENKKKLEEKKKKKKLSTEENGKENHRMEKIIERI